MIEQTYTKNHNHGSMCPSYNSHYTFMSPPNNIKRNSNRNQLHKITQPINPQNLFPYPTFTSYILNANDKLIQQITQTKNQRNNLRLFDSQGKDNIIQLTKRANHLYKIPQNIKGVQRQQLNRNIPPNSTIPKLNNSGTHARITKQKPKLLNINQAKQLSGTNLNQDTPQIKTRRKQTVNSLKTIQKLTEQNKWLKANYDLIQKQVIQTRQQLKQNIAEMNQHRKMFQNVDTINQIRHKLFDKLQSGSQQTLLNTQHHKQSIKILQSKIINLQISHAKDLQNKDEQINKLKQSITYFTQQKQSMTNKILIMRQQIKQMNDQLILVKDTFNQKYGLKLFEEQKNQEVEIKCKQYQQLINNEVNTQMNKLRQQFDQQKIYLKDINTTLQSKNKLLENQINRIKTQNSSIVRINGHKEKQLNTLRNQNKQLKSTIQMKQSIILEINQQKSILINKVQQLTYSRDQILKVLGQQLSKTQAENTSKQHIIQELQIHMSNQVNQIKSLKTDEIPRLQNHIQQVESLLQKVQVEVLDKNDKIQQLLSVLEFSRTLKSNSPNLQNDQTQKYKLTISQNKSQLHQQIDLQSPNQKYQQAQIDLQIDSLNKTPKDLVVAHPSQHKLLLQNQCKQLQWKIDCMNQQLTQKNKQISQLQATLTQTLCYIEQLKPILQKFNCIIEKKDEQQNIQNRNISKQLQFLRQNNCKLKAECDNQNERVDYLQALLQNAQRTSTDKVNQSIQIQLLKQLPNKISQLQLQKQALLSKYNQQYQNLSSRFKQQKQQIIQNYKKQIEQIKSNSNEQILLQNQKLKNSIKSLSNKLNLMQNINPLFQSKQQNQQQCQKMRQELQLVVEINIKLRQQNQQLSIKNKQLLNSFNPILNDQSHSISQIQTAMKQVELYKKQIQTLINQHQQQIIDLQKQIQDKYIEIEALHAQNQYIRNEKHKTLQPQQDIECLKLQIYYYQQLRQQLESGLKQKDMSAKQTITQLQYQIQDQVYMTKLVEQNLIQLAKQNEILFGDNITLQDQTQSLEQKIIYCYQIIDKQKKQLNKQSNISSIFGKISVHSQTSTNLQKKLIIQLINRNKFTQKEKQQIEQIILSDRQVNQSINNSSSITVNVQQFNSHIMSIIKQYYDNNQTNLRQQLQQFLKSLIKYPDHQQLFALFDIFTQRISAIQFSNLKFLKEKDLTIQDHLSNMNKIFNQQLSKYQSSNNNIEIIQAHLNEEQEESSVENQIEDRQENQ